MSVLVTGQERVQGWRAAARGRPGHDRHNDRHKACPRQAPGQSLLQPVGFVAAGAPPPPPLLALRRTCVARAMPSPAAAGAVELHRARFVEWTPAAVAALAATADGSALAVGRDDGSIELYDVGGDWRCALRIPGCEGASITCLLWCESGGDSSAAAAGGAAAAPAAPLRLLSAGLSGHIVEWDLRTLRPLASTDSTGGPVWHMSARPCVPSSASPQARRTRLAARRQRFPVTHLSARLRTQCFAVACDDGCLRLFGAWRTARAAWWQPASPLKLPPRRSASATEPASKGVAYARSFPRIEARLLCTAWHPNCTTIVVGSSDGCLRCWDSRTTTELLRITLTHGAAARVTPCVWAVLVLPDGTLASGDSEGCTSLWDGEHGTLRQSFKSHEADVLALASTPAGDAVFAAGVDSKVALLARVPSGTSGPTPDAALPPVAAWSLLGYKRAHTHDVRALAVAPFPPADARHDDGGGAQLGSMLLSAGTDAQLLAYAADNFLGEHPVRVVRTPAGPALSLAAHPLEALGARPLLLCMHSTWLDVWQIGVAAERSHAATPLVRAMQRLYLRPSCADVETARRSMAQRCPLRLRRPCLRASACDASVTCCAAPLRAMAVAWRRRTRWRRTFLRSLQARAASVCALPNGRSLLICRQRSIWCVRGWTIEPRATFVLRRLTTAARAARQAFTADGQHVALAAPAGPVYLVAVSSGVVAHVFRSHLKPRSAPTPRTRFCIALPPVTHVSVSPDRSEPLCLLSRAHAHVR